MPTLFKAIQHIRTRTTGGNKELNLYLQSRFENNLLQYNFKRTVISFEKIIYVAHENRHMVILATGSDNKSTLSLFNLSSSKPLWSLTLEPQRHRFLDYEFWIDGLFVSESGIVLVESHWEHKLFSYRIFNNGCQIGSFSTEDCIRSLKVVNESIFGISDSNGNLTLSEWDIFGKLTRILYLLHTNIQYITFAILILRRMKLSNFEK